MAIKMQGFWLVSVKSKNASFPQQFEIAGATLGNGIYPGTHPTEVTVTGNSWTISIRNNPGAGFVSSQVKLKFPTVSGGFYRFDIQSNDAGQDQDFDDLVLTCRTPVTANDYLLYGSVSTYAGICFRNPCSPQWVIDTPTKFLEALKVPALRDWLKKVHPDRFAEIQPPFPPDPIGPVATNRLDAVALNPQPLPPKAFVPIVVPLPGELATPLKVRNVVYTEERTLELPAQDKSAKSAVEPVRFQVIKNVEAVKSTGFDLDAATLGQRVSVEKGLSKFLRCDIDPLANVRVRFWEYDRTAAEKAGGPYTGDGVRTPLGSTFTDDFGNYIFRFTYSSISAGDEGANDVGLGENASLQIPPDIIAQVMQPLAPSVPAFETAPYWNIPFLKRINVCVPREHIGIRPLACDGQHIIQGIGNIVLAPLAANGTRVGASNVLDADGVVTSKNSLGPSTDCAAWHGTLLMRGCLKNSAIKYYTLEHRKPGGAWSSLDIQFTLPIFIGSVLTSRAVNQSTPGLYLNVETDSGDWLMAYRNIKAQFSTAIFDNGPREIRITGLNASLAPIGFQETVTLFILNSAPDLAIDPVVSMAGSGSISDCGLFTLPAGDEDPAITARFKAVQGTPLSFFERFMGGYELYMHKGSTGGFGVTPGVLPSNAPYTTPPGNRGRYYVPAAGGGLSCDLSFRGTSNEPSDVSGFIEVALAPQSGHWLEPAQQFCTFGLYLQGWLRRTNGESANWVSYAPNPVLFGIQR